MKMGGHSIVGAIAVNQEKVEFVSAKNGPHLLNRLRTARIRSQTEDSLRFVGHPGMYS